jgi:predicted secreted protein
MFAVLPLGTHPVSAADEHTGRRCAPARPRLGLKALATTLIAALIWFGAYLLITSDWLSFRHGWLMLQD